MKPDWFPDWTGKTCVIVACGPTAGQADLDVIRGRAKVVVINASFKLAPWADVLYACDDAFWRVYHDEAFAFRGLKVTQDAIAVARYHTAAVSELKRVICDKIDHLVDKPGTIGWGGNSGFQAINLAVQFGVKKIVLVGYDLRIDRGLHWHGKHPKSMNNPIEKNVTRWRRAIDDIASVLTGRGIEVLNASPVSKLENYPKVSLKEVFSDRPVAPRKEAKRILAISPTISGPEEVFSYGDVYAFYIQQEMRRRGIDLVIMPRAENPEAYFETLPLEEFDHLIGFGLRYFDKNFTSKQMAVIKGRVRGAVTQFAEFPRERSIADVNFTSKGIPPGRERRPYAPYHVIGWAADPDLCAPAQKSDGVLRILLDHYDYDPKRKERDQTDFILEQIENLRTSPLLAKAGFNSIETDMLTTPKGGAERVPFSELAKRYGSAHIFINGHAESVGLCIIEAATAGCLVVAPRDYIPRELMEMIRRIEFDGRTIPWELILRKIDAKASRKRAVLQSWSSACDRLLIWLGDFRK